MNYVTFVDAPLELVRCIYHTSNSDRNDEATNLAIWLTGAPRRGTPAHPNKNCLEKKDTESCSLPLEIEISLVIQWV